MKKVRARARARARACVRALHQLIQTPEVRANQPRSWDCDWAGTGLGLGLS